MKYEGYNGQVTVDGDALVITREGLAARASFGKDTPPRRIPLQAVSEVRLKAASRMSNGWLQLLLGGEDKAEPKATNAGGDPDVVMFTNKKQEPFEQLHAWLTTVVA